MSSATSRGYLGPLGDDFPAIFPIAMGLLLFFSSITLTYDYYNTKRDTAVLMEANVALAKSARSQIVFTDEHWDAVCRLADKAKANYGVRAMMTMSEMTDDYVFEAMEIGDSNPCVDIDGPAAGRFYVSMTYPVLIGTEGGYEVRTMEVTTWK